MSYLRDEDFAINNKYDYSNVIPTVDYISYLVEYCDNIAKEFEKILDNDMKRNEKIKYELQDYTYKKTYGKILEISVREKETYNRVNYHNYEEFKNAVFANKINKLDKFVISLNLNFDRGRNNNLQEFINKFSISFEPYDITFTRLSNCVDADMNQVENTINQIFKKMPISNTIFYSK